MSGRINWRRLGSHNRMRRQGVEDVKGKTPVIDQLPKQPRRKMSKAELCEQAEAAVLAWRASSEVDPALRQRLIRSKKLH